MPEAGHPQPVLGTTQREGVGREAAGVQDAGTHVYLWLIHADARQSPSQYGKGIILQLN